MNSIRKISIGEFKVFRRISFNDRRKLSVTLARLNKVYRSEKTPSTMVMDTINGRTVVVRYAGILEKVGGRYMIPRNPIMDL